MRGLDKLFFAAFLGLIGLGLWNVRDWLTRVPISVSASPFTSTPSKPVSIPVPATQNTTKHAKNAGHLAAEALSPSALSTSVIEVPYSGPPFPEPKDFPNGITGAQIRADFGAPAARITVSIGGQLVEKYYYLNREHTRYTIANLQDGRVISADSKPM